MTRSRGVLDFFLRHEYGHLNHLFDGLLNDSSLMDYLGCMNHFFPLVRDMDIEYYFLLNVMMSAMIDPRRHEEDISLSHGYGYLNHLFNGLLNDSFLRD